MFCKNNGLKILVSLFCAVCVCLNITSCKNKEINKEIDKTPVTDSMGNTVYLDKNSKVVSCFSSFSEMWLLSGGKLCGVTDDAVNEHKLDVGSAQIIGGVKNIDVEKVVSLNPDYVILSADLAVHLSLKDAFDNMGIPCGYFREDTFDDYKSIMKQFCNVNERADLYHVNVIDVENSIDKIKNQIPKTNKSVLLIRAFSTGMKAKTNDNLAGQILNEFGLVNIASSNKSMLEDISMEYIVESDPDYIFVTTMGNHAGAVKFLQDNALNNPAWSELTAIKNNNYHILPKELFHYKPNNRWSESYEYIAKLICPEVFKKSDNN